MLSIFYMTEGFVQKSIIIWLKSKGYKITKDTYQLFGVDIKAYNYAGERFYIEVKGETKGENNLDFCAGLGQLLIRMNKKIEPRVHYGFGLPKTRHFERQYEKFLKLPLKLRRSLKIRFLFVNSKGKVEEIRSWKNL